MTDAALKSKSVQSALDVFRKYEHFCKAMIDAYIIIDNKGQVLKCNQLFSQLVGAKTRQILRAESVDQLLQLFIGDKPLPILKLLGNDTPTRIDEVRGENHIRSDLNFIISTYPLLGDEGQLGAFVLIRDVTAETNLQDKYKTTAIKSITDPLTGLFTRAYFEDYLNMHERNIHSGRVAIQNPKMLSIMMLDIDHFKRVNDDYGHQAGDHILRIVSGIIKDSLRKTDIVCRYGGEEFICILPGTTYVGAANAGDKVRSAVEAEKIKFEGKDIPVTISIGTAELDSNNEDYKKTIGRADAALYSSKENGRNAVSYHDGQTIKKHA